MLTVDQTLRGCDEHSHRTRAWSDAKFRPPQVRGQTGWSATRMMNAAVGLAVLEGKRYLSLETYRKSGKGVRTPVWFAVEPTNAPASNPWKLYVYTATDSGKAKRIRQKGVVKIAPCDGPWECVRPMDRWARRDRQRRRVRPRYGAYQPQILSVEADPRFIRITVSPS